MKREMHITITLDTETAAVSSTQVYVHPLNHDRFRAEINVNPAIGIIPSNAGEPMLTLLPTLCHEVGHALASLIEAPAAKKAHSVSPFLRFLGDTLKISDPTIVPVEEEAWDIGQRIFDAVRKIGVGTYKTAEARKLALSNKLEKASVKANKLVNKQFDESPLFSLLDEEPSST